MSEQQDHLDIPQLTFRAGDEHFPCIRKILRQLWIQRPASIAEELAGLGVSDGALHVGTMGMVGSPVVARLCFRQSNTSGKLENLFTVIHTHSQLVHRDLYEAEGHPVWRAVLCAPCPPMKYAGQASNWPRFSSALWRASLTASNRAGNSTGWFAWRLENSSSF